MNFLQLQIQAHDMVNAIVGPVFGLGNEGVLTPGDTNIDVTGTLEGGTEFIQTAGGYFIVLLGAILIVFGGYKIFLKKVKERDDASWPGIVATMIIGAAMAMYGFNIVFNLGAIGANTIEGFSAVILFPW